ncbi:hypothetical protein SEPCBS57363_003100 [Sporothrix epigloea]|uniref:Microbial-type PARG catalytic domain-containing protein n=1 Tax=Sporothrix epigloea TaxID=1892477 RepID=A0ABP0DJJ8_9PEZI
MRLTAFFRPVNNGPSVGNSLPAQASASATQSSSASRGSTAVDRCLDRNRNRQRDADRRGGQRLGRYGGRGDGPYAEGRDHSRDGYRGRDQNGDQQQVRDGSHRDRVGRREWAEGSHCTSNIVPRATYPPGQRDRLREDAQETLCALPKILDMLGTCERASAVYKYDPWSLPALDPSQCPRFPRPATIRVIDSDTINAALGLQQFTHADLLSDAKTEAGTPLRPPMIVNFASHKRPGGGWLNGALAQEEALCYRSSLALSLDRGLYPLDREDVLYSPYVLIVRSDRSSGHHLLVPSMPSRDLPIVSAVSVAALQRPALRMVPVDKNGNYTNDAFEGPFETKDTQAIENTLGRSSASQCSAVSWSQSDYAVAANPQHEYTSQPTSPTRVSRPPSQQRSRSRSSSVNQSAYDASRCSQSTLALHPPAPSATAAASEELFTCSPSTRPKRSQLLSGLRPETDASSSLYETPARERAIFAYETDRFCTKLKMQLVLRAAARRGHHQLVLGALGCGVFGNPPEEVARCWLEVLLSPEFTTGGHWWQDVVFAVYNGQQSQNGQTDLGTRSVGEAASNYRIFHDILDGKQV